MVWLTRSTDCFFLCRLDGSKDVGKKIKNTEHMQRFKQGVTTNNR